MSKVTQYVRHLAVVAIATLAAQFGRAEGDELNYTWRDGWNADPAQTVTYGAYTGQEGILFAGQQMGIVAQVKLVSNVSANVINFRGDYNYVVLATNADGKYTLSSYALGSSITSETVATTGWHRYSMFVRRGINGSGHQASVIVYVDGVELFSTTQGSFGSGPFKTVTIGGAGNLAKGGHWAADATTHRGARAGSEDGDATQIAQIEADCVKMYPPVDESVVAKIGETGYQTLDEAMTYATENATAEAPITVKLVALHTDNVTIPENVTVEMNVDNRIVGVVSGAGTVKLSQASTATQGELATWIGDGKMTFDQFTGTVHLASGRFKATEAIGQKIKVTNGAQLFLDGGTWTNTIELEGDGYGTERSFSGPSAIGRAALRFESGNIDGATIETTGTGDNAPAIGSHDANRTFACTISGSGDLRLVLGTGTHTYTLTKSKSFTGALTVVDANLTVNGTFTNNAIKGAGTVIFDGKLPTAANALNSEAWTGTAWIKNYKNAVLFRDAQAYGKIRMTNVTDCWLYNGRPDQTGYTLELVDEGENVALNLKENSGYHFYFTKLTGSGTLSITQTDARNRRYSFADVSEFTGKIAHASANSTIILGANEDSQRQGDVVIKAPVTLSSVAVPEGKNVVLAAEAATLTVPAELDAGVVTTTVSGKKVVFDDETKTYSLADPTAAEIFIEAIAAAADGATVTLTDDITLEARIDVAAAEKSITLDLGGYTITPTATCANGSAFNIVSGTVTIKNGTIDGTAITQTAEQAAAYENECDPITVRSGAAVTLSELTIAINSVTGACAYPFDGATLTVLSGTYTNDTTVEGMSFNQADVATQAVFVKGGSMSKDPALGDNSGKCKSFLASGYVSTLNEETGLYDVTEKTEPDRPSDIGDDDKSAYDAWATEHGVTGETAASLAVAFKMGVSTTTTGMTPEQAVAAVEAAAVTKADELLKEVATTEGIDLAAVLKAGEFDAATVAAFEAAHPGLTIALVVAEEITAVEGESAFYKLELKLK